MANEEHVKILKHGVVVWNKWRREYSEIRPDLSHADLSRADLSRADLSHADLSRADLSRSDLSRADLSHADLRGAQIDGTTQIEDKWRLVWEILNKAAAGRDLSGANLSEVNLSGVNLNGAKLSQTNLGGADLSYADLSGADLSGTRIDGAIQIDTKLRLVWEIVNEGAAGRDLNQVDLSGADLREVNLVSANLADANLSAVNLTRANLTGANLIRAQLEGAFLEQATLVETNLEEANLSRCHIYGIAAWELNLKGTTQRDLIITRQGEPTITVDNLEVAQFVYLLLNNEKIRDIINTITTKAVLILGRFTPERIKILNVLRDALRSQNYVPILFDFDKPATRDLTETVRTLAHMARFIIADLTLPRSIPQELQAIVPDLAIPIQPILMKGVDSEYAMFQDLRRKYHWVLKTYEYQGLDELLAGLEGKIIVPAETKAQELEQGRIDVV